jgi:hypothetical protein
MTLLLKGQFLIKSTITQSKQTESQPVAKPRFDTDELLSAASQSLFHIINVRINVDVIHPTVIYTHLKRPNASVEPDTSNQP